MAKIRLGAFELVGPLGAGGMGKVWHGRHSEAGTDVAIKVMRQEVMDDPEYRQAFEMEVRSVASLDHPHIVTILDYGQIPQNLAGVDQDLQPGSPYLVMEYARGGAVDDYFNRLRWPDLRELLLIILDALAHAHAREVIHRDLKPENILVGCGPNWDVKLTDFGLAYASDKFLDSGEVETAWGTPQYMAPEQLRGLWREYGPWTDLYGLGCMAYELICGSWPFDGETPWDIGQAHINEPIPALKPRFPVPEGTEQWIRKLLAKDRAHRFTHAADAGYALGQLPSLEEKQRFGVLFQAPTMRGMAQAVPEDATSQVSTQLFPSLVATTKNPPQSDLIQIPTEPASLVFELPPLPNDWRPKFESQLSNELMGISLGLFGLRAVPMVGREEERDKLWRLLREVHTRKESRIILVEGAAGTGKSELVRRMAWRARETGGARVLSAFHSPVLGPTEGLIPMVDRFLKATRIAPETRPYHLEKALHGEGLSESFDLRALMALFEGVDRRESGKLGRKAMLGREERYAILYRFLALLSEKRPVWLWLDDVQWGLDTLGFVEYIEAEQATNPAALFVVMTARTEALRERPSEARAVQELMESPRAARLLLDGLDQEESRKLVRQLLRLDEELANHILQRSGGIPLFAVQLVDDWVARGKLQMGREGFMLKPGADIAIPDDLHELWERRIQGFLETRAPETLYYLELAAALGQEVDEREWLEAQRLAGMPVISGLVERLVDENLARRMGGSWQFAHGLLQESLERGAREAGRWAALNRTCAQMLETIYDEQELGLAERVAWHWIEAGEPARALEPLSLAIDLGVERSDFEHAEDLIAWRDEICEPGDVFWLLKGKVDRARVAGRRGAYQRCAEIAEEAAREAQAEGMVHVAAQAMVWAGLGFRAIGSLKRAEEFLSRAGKFFANQGEKQLMAQCVLELGRVAEQRGDFELARGHFEHSRGLFKELEDVYGVAQCFNALGDARRQSGDYAGARQASLAALERFETLGNLAGIADCLNDLAELAMMQGQLEDGRRFAEEAVRLYRSVGSDDVYFVRLNLGMIYLEGESFAEAASLFESLVKVFDQKALKALAAQARAGLLAARLSMGSWEMVGELLTQIEEAFRITGVRNRQVTRALGRAIEKARSAGEPGLAQRLAALARVQAEGMRQAMVNEDEIQ